MMSLANFTQSLLDEELQILGLNVTVFARQGDILAALPLVTQGTSRGRCQAANVLGYYGFNTG